nr:SusC/RagA family TonB-linked outer membrane protein [Prevotella sp. oral taxon 317]
MTVMNEKQKKPQAFWRMCLVALICMLSSTLYAQNITVTGTVKDPMGEPVIGASVSVQGTRAGTVTNIDGHYSIECSPQATLVFSYLGFKAKSVAVNGRQQVDVDFEDDATALNEVVVTALGIKRQTKALGYAVTELKSDELERANTVSPVTALQGKVAGVEISQSDGGMFGSTKIQIRGASTLNANNQPIFVVDGVILDNATSDSGDADWNTNTSDYGNQLKNLNPDDFESVSVLKGAAATALYGSRGLNGAVVITTKSGKAGKGVSVRFSQTVGLETVYRSPDLQNKYLLGSFPGGVDYDEYYTKTGNTWGDNMSSFARNSKGDYSFIEQYGNVAWGPEISWAEGKQFEQYDGTMGPARIFKNNYKDAYDTGINTNTNVSLQGGNDRTQFYASASYKYNKGTTPRNTFNRFSFLGKASQKVGDIMTVDFSINFTQSQPRNAPLNIGEYFAKGTFPREYDVNRYRHLYKGEHGGLADGKYGDQYRAVPGRDLWWNIYENDYRQTETVFRPVLNLNVQALPWLQLSAGGSLNYYAVSGEYKAPGSGYANEGGSYALSHTQTTQENFYLAANANYQINDDWEVHGFLREEYFNQYAQLHSESTNGGLIVPNQYFIKNSKLQPDIDTHKFNTKRIVSTIFMVGTSWKNQLFLDVTGRNDWSSALVYSYGRGNFSYFYPSVSGSWIITESFKDTLPKWVSFAKVRGSWAQVGNDTSPYYINSGYEIATYQRGDKKVYGMKIPDKMKSTDLKPERKNAWEVGLDWRFLDSRIGLDFTYYKENTRNQIMTIDVPGPSGVKQKLINAGNIQNSGIEVALNTTPYKRGDWQWDLNLTYTRNRNKIVELSPDVASYINLDGSATYGNYRIASVAKVGSDYGMLMSDSWIKTDEKTGKPIIGYTNNYRTVYYKRGGTVKEVGSMLPDFLGTVNTTLRWKDLSLYVLFDARFGGYVASYNSRYSTAYGFSGESEKYRKGMTWTSRYDNAKGKTFTDGFIPDAIFDQGTIVTAPDGTQHDVSGKTYQEAYEKGYVEPAHMQGHGYFKNSWGQGVINDDWFKKLNYIALREVTLSYNVPRRLCSYIGAKSLALSLTGRNIAYLLNTAPNHENPESVRGTGAAQFRMRSFMPYTASYLFTLNATF